MIKQPNCSTQNIIHKYTKNRTILSLKAFSGMRVQNIQDCVMMPQCIMSLEFSLNNSELELFNKFCVISLDISCSLYINRKNLKFIIKQILYILLKLLISESMMKALSQQTASC